MKSLFEKASSGLLRETPVDRVGPAVESIPVTGQTCDEAVLREILHAG